MGKPRLLDLFCGAGGCSVGYARAGFEVVGVDIRPQKRYPFTFHCVDALTFPLEGFDAVHASPPCQGYGQTRHIRHERTPDYPLLLADMRDRLMASGLAWVLENVPHAPMVHGLEICGTALGLRVRRHRLFDCSVPLFAPGPCRHGADDLGIYNAKVTRLSTRATPYLASSGKTHYRPQRGTLADGQVAMGIDWMTQAELSQAIPPLYTEWLGRQLLAALRNGAAA